MEALLQPSLNRGAECDNNARVFTEKFLVSVHSVDCHQRLKLSEICNLMQETSIRHADHLGIGYELMNRIQHAWMIHEIRIEIERPPTVGELVTVETWSRGIQGLTALREFRLSDQLGRTIALASTSWLLIDLVKRRPERIETHFAYLGNQIGGVATRRPVGKVRLPAELSLLDERVVRFNEIDLNRHVNNAQYLAWIEDTVGQFLLDGHHILGFEINYVTGSTMGDAIEICGTHAPECPHCTDDAAQAQFIAIRRKGEAGHIVRACLEWSH